MSDPIGKPGGTWAPPAGKKFRLRAHVRIDDETVTIEPSQPSHLGLPAYLVVAGTALDGTTHLIAVEPDGTLRLSDETIERIARRMVDLLKTPERFDLSQERSDPWA